MAHICLLLSVVCGMCGLGGEAADPGDPTDNIDGDVTDDVGECKPGECIGCDPGEGCVDDGMLCIPAP